MRTKAEQLFLGLTRVALGLIFLWAFFDKVFGLGFATKPTAAWIAGGSPTMGFLKFATKGPFAPVFNSMAGSPLVDWLFMLGLLGLGLALLLGIGMHIAAFSGVLLMALMYLAVLPPEHHPFLDEHIVYALTLVVLYCADAGAYLGMGAKWRELSLVKRYPVLR